MTAFLERPISPSPVPGHCRPIDRLSLTGPDETSAASVAPTLATHYLEHMADYLLKLFGPRRDKLRTALGEIDVSAHDDLAAVKRLKDTFPDRLSECDCAELYGPDDKLVWEQNSDAET
jgi:hypothetical protein